MYTEKLVNEVLGNIKNIMGSQKIEKIENHFAGYFNELGITVTLTDESSINEMNLFAQKALEYLNMKLPIDSGDFKWTLSFYQSQKQIGLFFPGDAVNDNSARY